MTRDTGEQERVLVKGFWFEIRQYLDWLAST
jgi:hypothetical protein